jgi:hypothetical protein
MSRLTILSSAFVAVVLLAAMAHAQEQQRPRQRGMGGGLDALQLVRNEAVQKDIAVKEDQSGKLQELLAAYQKDLAAIPQLSREDAQKLTDEERRTKAQEAREASSKVQDTYQKQLAGMLDKTQLERLNQIRLQAAGPSAIGTPEVATALGLSREDRQKIQAALNELNQGRQRGERPTEEQRAALRDKLEAKLKELLTPEQLAKFEELKGKPFDVSQLRGRPRRPTNN